MKTVFIGVAAFIAGAWGGFAIGSNKGSDGTVVIVEHDTIIERLPPIAVERPVGPEIIVVPESAVTETSSPDSLEVLIERIQRQYEGEEYRAWVSGVEPQLDSIEIRRPQYQLESQAVNTQRPHRWGISAGVGLTATAGGISPGVFIGVTYRLWEF